MFVNLRIIKEKRKNEGYTIDDMSRKLGLTNGSMYYKREVGQYKFKAEELMEISNILRIPIELLFSSDKYSKIEKIESRSENVKDKQAI
ncbi:helix-turn-helix domain-containing protein [Virgibacillus dokdonensis]|uniref:Helix-turn-helix domain protein n=1 Tax=Virgibacillus dokdonensis TaxID=302167 RepID=A0A2K9IZK9_9BACI|nr:helix-turn-helix transcriptional regulator [Virgibacillus dokdonensis]AUJ25152.1 Helix-turn-helix domain protein [Virgibacillus dokdonensis]